MDLKTELLAVLDNPEDVWDALIRGFDRDTRNVLLVLATHRTPIELREWQSAVARVDVAASTRFEAALRVLDDLFVATRRVRQTHVANFRNPSMDDFCVGFMERNTGIAVEVAWREPSLAQVLRLIALASASDESGAHRRYPNLAAVLLENPTALLTSLVRLAASDSVDALPAIADVLILAGVAAIGSQVAAVEVLCESILSADFRTNPRLLYAVLDRKPRARLVNRLLGGKFGEFYVRLWNSATHLHHFDTLANLDHALGRTGQEAAWAERFESLAGSWIEGISERSDAESLRETHDRVVEFLMIDDLWFDEWEGLMESLAEDGDGRDYYEPPYERGPRGGSGGSATSTFHTEVHVIESMFGHLADRDE